MAGNSRTKRATAGSSSPRQAWTERTSASTRLRRAARSASRNELAWSVVKQPSPTASRRGRSGGGRTVQMVTRRGHTSVDSSPPAQAAPAPGPNPARGAHAASTAGQRAGLAERLRHHVAALEGIRHPGAAPERHRAARDYLARELGALGLDVALAPFAFRGRTYHNVVARMPGSDARRPGLLIGAHFDSPARPPGADETARGVAALVECARLLASRTLQAGVEFVGFDLEEVQT